MRDTDSKNVHVISILKQDKRYMLWRVPADCPSLQTLRCNHYHKCRQLVHRAQTVSIKRGEVPSCPSNWYRIENTIPNLSAWDSPRLRTVQAKFPTKGGNIS